MSVSVLFCRAKEAVERCIRAGSFQELQWVEKQETKGPVQYLEEGSDASPDESLFSWWC
jgi:hypothetical protein